MWLGEQGEISGIRRNIFPEEPLENCTSQYRSDSFPGHLDLGEESQLQTLCVGLIKGVADQMMMFP